MSSKANLTVKDRIDQLMQHLGIAKAHFAGRLAVDWAGCALAFSDRILSLTLVCPPAIPPPAIGEVAYRTLVFNGDRGPFADSVKQIVEGDSGINLVTISDYAGLLWSEGLALLSER